MTSLVEYIRPCGVSKNDGGASTAAIHYKKYFNVISFPVPKTKFELCFAWHVFKKTQGTATNLL